LSPVPHTGIGDPVWNTGHECPHGFCPVARPLHLEALSLFPVIWKDNAKVAAYPVLAIELAEDAAVLCDEDRLLEYMEVVNRSPTNEMIVSPALQSMLTYARMLIRSPDALDWLLWVRKHISAMWFTFIARSRLNECMSRL